MVSTPRKQCPFLRGLDLNSLGSSYKLSACENTNLFLCSCCSQGSQWCYLTILASAAPFSFCLQVSPAWGSFLMSWLFTSGGQSIGASASASVLPMNTQDWSPLGWSGWIFLQSKGLKGFLQHHSSKASTLQRSAFFMVQLSHPYTTTGKTIALTRWIFVGKVMSLLFMKNGTDEPLCVAGIETQP